MSIICFLWKQILNSSLSSWSITIFSSGTPLHPSNQPPNHPHPIQPHNQPTTRSTTHQTTHPMPQPKTPPSSEMSTSTTVPWKDGINFSKNPLFLFVGVFHGNMTIMKESDMTTMTFWSASLIGRLTRWRK